MSSSNYFQDLQYILARIDLTQLAAAASVINGARLAGGTIFTCGNGGAAAEASHFAADLGKNVRALPPFRTICLADSVPAITAYSNDEGVEQVFSSQLHRHGRSSDLLIAYSGSGMSANIVEVIKIAEVLDMSVIAIFGDFPVWLPVTVQVKLGTTVYELNETAMSACNHYLITALRDLVSA